jgi:hypothetical protein
LTVADIFDLTITTNGSWFTKTFINSHTGDIPVYGASKNEKDVGYGYIQDNIERVKYFSDCLTWNIDGSFGLFLRQGRFSLSEKVIPLIVKDKYKHKLLLDFLRVAITAVVLKDPFSFTNKGGKTRFGNISITLPVNADEEFDIDAQKTFAAQFEFIEQMKAEVANKREQILRLTIDIDLSSYSMVYKPITELFAVKRGGGKYTKTHTQKHLGEYPLYSGNTFGAFAYIDSYDYDTPCLTWAIDGLAGYMMVHKAPFSATNHRGVLLPKTAGIDIDYFKFALEPLLRQAKKGRVGDNGENEYTSLPPFMLKDIEVGVPVDEKGEISIELQREIAASYLAIEQYRRDILGKLDTLTEQRIEY